MPAVSEQQQKAAGLALAAKRGEIDPKTLTGAAKQMYESMTAKQLEEYAGTKHKGIPEKAAKGKAVTGPTVVQVGEKGKEYALLMPGSVVAPMGKGEKPTMTGGLKAILEQVFKSVPQGAQGGMSTIPLRGGSRSMWRQRSPAPRIERTPGTQGTPMPGYHPRAPIARSPVSGPYKTAETAGQPVPTPGGGAAGGGEVGAAGPNLPVEFMNIPFIRELFGGGGNSLLQQMVGTAEPFGPDVAMPNWQAMNYYDYMKKPGYVQDMLKAIASAFGMPEEQAIEQGRRATGLAYGSPLARGFVPGVRR